MRLATLGLLSAVVFLCPGPVQSQEPRDLVETAVAAGSFKTLAAALEAAGLVETLQGDGPFTVFAPTDDAFAKLPEGTVETLLRPENKDQLVAILTFHVAAGRLDASGALAARSVETVQGDSIEFRLEKGIFTVNGTRVIENDIATANGVIHVIDSVLIPSTEQAPADAVLSLFQFAIERGVPLFNDGRHDACAAVYEVAVRSVAQRPGELPKDLVGDLRRALASVDRSDDDNTNAWTLRRAMDRTMHRLMQDPSPENATRITPGDESSAGLKTVFAFDGVGDPWRTVNDDVMGGISRSKFERTNQGTARFKGALSLENNGGFATMRSPARDLELGGYDGLILRVRGDGRTYGISGLPSDRRREINIWQTQFTTVSGEWMEIQVPFRALVRQVMGRRLPQSGPLPAERIASIGFSISDKNETPFELEIDWIKAYKGVASF